MGTNSKENVGLCCAVSGDPCLELGLAPPFFSSLPFPSLATITNTYELSYMHGWWIGGSCGQDWRNDPHPHWAASDMVPPPLRAGPVRRVGLLWPIKPRVSTVRCPPLWKHQVELPGGLLSMVFSSLPAGNSWVGEKKGSWVVGEPNPPIARALWAPTIPLPSYRGVWFVLGIRGWAQWYVVLLPCCLRVGPIRHVRLLWSVNQQYQHSDA